MIDISKLAICIDRCNCDKIYMVDPAFMHVVIGMQDEMGELSEILKRALYYGDPIDDDHVMEEHGDMMFYILRDCMRMAKKRGLNTAIVFQEILDRVVAKLCERYKKGFTEAEATESGRDRAAEQEAMSRIHNLREEPVYESPGDSKSDTDRIGERLTPNSPGVPRTSEMENI